MKINPSSHVPIYMQIAEGIRESVASGVYLPEEPLPSLRALALEIQVNPNTVQRAYEELARSGLIYSRRGKGMFVARKGSADARTESERTVRRSFDEGIRAGYSAGMTAKAIRTVFKQSLDAKANREK